MKTKTNDIDFEQVLKNAIEIPGKIQAAYSAFNSYSTQNQMLIMFQCDSREIPIGPVGTFKFWESKGRRVMKGSKALSMLVPCTFSKESENDDGEIETKTRMFFKAKNSWFVLSQTEGADFSPETVALPEFSETKLLETLNIKRIPFSIPDGNVQGYAVVGKREIAVNPLAGLPFKTLIHEIAHIELGHTEQSLHDTDSIPKDLKEVEAESVALLVLESLGLDGAEYCRGYIQGWFRNRGEIPNKNAKRIMTVADRILKAGRS